MCILGFEADETEKNIANYSLILSLDITIELKVKFLITTLQPGCLGLTPEAQALAAFGTAC
jgi:hypothetical protein